jgi:hypothetical protein
MALSEGEERYEAMRSEFENSLSWRVTEPIRAARRLGRRRNSD